MFVLLIVNNDGGLPATLHPTLDEAKAAAFASLTTLDDGPSLDDEELARVKADLREVNGEFVQGVRGSDAWKEWAYIAPVSTAE